MEMINQREPAKTLRFVECPRDAMQGWPTFIPTAKKIDYLNALLKVGFDTLDFGSFVSAKAIPQMADTKDIVSNLDLSHSNTKLLAIVANERGAMEASVFEQISYLGFPFSVSETFQHRNTNSSISESLSRVEAIQGICVERAKELVIYISMGFGNPYGDPYIEDLVFGWVDKLVALGVNIISLADTVGVATSSQVFSITDYLIRRLPNQQVGVHLHARPGDWKEKIDAALRAGCRRFDGAMKGIGGCPMANDELVGNMNTEYLIPYFSELNLMPALNEMAIQESIRMAEEIFLN
jgi:hydroxymethylglutaryl-CoA lyase